MPSRQAGANVSLRLSLGKLPTGLKQNVGEMAASQNVAQASATIQHLAIRRGLWSRARP